MNYSRARPGHGSSAGRAAREDALAKTQQVVQNRERRDGQTSITAPVRSLTAVPLVQRQRVDTKGTVLLFCGLAAGGPVRGGPLSIDPVERQNSRRIQSIMTRRIGLIGCGGIVQRTHAIGYRALGDEGLVELAALADVSETNRAASGDLFGVPAGQRYADYREMLARAPVDTVAIATPHALHVAQAIAAAEAGKAIISEKPMAVTLEEADAILAAVERHRVPYTVVHNFLFSQPVLGAAALVREGSFGEPLLGRGEMLGNKPEETTRGDRDWRASRAMGGGALIDSSYHEIYTVEALMGSPIRYVEARVATLKFPIDVDDTALMTFEHANGRLSTVHATWHSRNPVHRGRWVWINGTRGAIRVVYADEEPLARSAGTGNRWEPVHPESLAGIRPGLPGDSTGHGAFLRAAVEAFDRGGPSPVTGAQARHNLAIIEGAREASASRRAVEVK
jgi:UDP-N-acetyl-2-amino-2-deoxyglucuronate dehydrogenase